MGATQLVVGTVIWVVLFIILFIPVTILIVYKYSVILLAKILRPELHTITSNDAMVSPGSTEAKPLYNFGFLIKCKGHIKIEALRDRFQTCFIQPRDELNQTRAKYERFYSYLVTYGGYVFRKSVNDINIDSHVYEMKLGQKESVEELAARWILQKYTENTPTWEAILVPQSETEETVVCFKIHHAFADGYSLLYLIDKMTGVKSPYLVKPFEDSVLKEIKQTLEAPCYLGKFGGDPDGNPFKILLSEKPSWQFSFATLDLKLIKRIRKKENVHFASVLLTLIAGVLRKYLLETKTEDELTKDLSCGTTLPWPNHPVRSPTVSMCNHWVVGILKLPIDSNNPLERLKKIEENFADFQNLGLNKFMKRFLMPFMGLLPARWKQGMLEKDAGFPVGLTSIVGGNDYKMIARPVSIIQPLLAIPDGNPYIAFSCFTFSHSDSLDVTFSTHPDLFPTTEIMHRISHDYLNEELAELCRLCDISSCAEVVDNK